MSVNEAGQGSSQIKFSEDPNELSALYQVEERESCVPKARRQAGKLLPLTLFAGWSYGAVEVFGYLTLEKEF